MILEIEKALDSARKLWGFAAASGNSLDNAVGAMCVAHVSYWAWARAQEMNWKGLALRLVVQSYQASDAASKLLEPGSLMWAFSINHSAYIRVRANIDRDRTHALMHQLGELNEEHNHYRFADTRAWAFTEQAERIIAMYSLSRLISESDLADARNSACENVSSAQRRLDQGRPWFGDIEITRHWDRLEELKLGLECSLIQPERHKNGN
jgi:hypothetical protein